MTPVQKRIEDLPSEIKIKVVHDYEKHMQARAVSIEQADLALKDSWLYQTLVEQMQLSDVDLEMIDLHMTVFVLYVYQDLYHIQRMMLKQYGHLYAELNGTNASGYIFPQSKLRRFWNRLWGIEPPTLMMAQTRKGNGFKLPTPRSDIAIPHDSREDYADIRQSKDICR